MISWFILLHAKADDFAIPKEAAIIVTILFVLLLAALGFYLFYTLESLCFTLKREREEEGEDAEVTFFVIFCQFHFFISIAQVEPSQAGVP